MLTHLLSNSTTRVRTTIAETRGGLWSVQSFGRVTGHGEQTAFEQ